MPRGPYGDPESEDPTDSFVSSSKNTSLLRCLAVALHPMVLPVVHSVSFFSREVHCSHLNSGKTYFSKPGKLLFSSSPLPLTHLLTCEILAKQQLRVCQTLHHNASPPDELHFNIQISYYGSPLFAKELQALQDAGHLLLFSKMPQFCVVGDSHGDWSICLAVLKNRPPFKNYKQIF